MTENMALFDGPAFSDIEQTTAEQIALSMGRKTPSKADYELAVRKAREWNEQRRELGLREW